MALDQELLVYLSKEIETHTNNMMVNRSRASLAVFIGPFAVLGSFLFGTKGASVPLRIDTVAVVVGLVACLSFLGLGYMSARIEEHVWNQCNRWRAIIARLYQGGKEIQASELEFKHNLRWAYLACYSFMLLSFVSVVFFLARVI